MKTSRFLVFWCGLGLAGCFMDSERNTGGKPRSSPAGTLYLENGEVAVNARVVGFSVNHLPDTSSREGLSTAGSAFVKRTDAKGRYSLDSVSEGFYTIIGELDGKLAYQDSVFLSASADDPAPITLKPPKSFAGIVSLQPNHDPRSATVQILGTNAFANVGADGRFRIDGLAGGRYRIRVVSTMVDYTPLYSIVSTAAGQDDTLSDTLWVPYTGIPVVTGLAYRYDTAQGIVALSWKPVDYPMLGNYVVFRDSAGALEPNEKPLALATGPAFADTLLLPSKTGLFTDSDSLDRQLEYWIKVRNKSNQTGLNYGILRVTAAAPYKVRTSITIRLAAARWDSVRRVDSTVVIATIKNPTRGLASIQWAVGDRSDTTEIHRLHGAKSIADTLRFGRSRQGPYTIWASVRDEAGNVREDSLRINVDEEPWMQRSSQLPNGSNLGGVPVFSNGKLYACMWSGNRFVRHGYDIVSHSWASSPAFTMDGSRSVRTIHAIGEELYLFGHEEGSSSAQDNRFDLRTGEMSPLPARKHPRNFFASASPAGRLYVIGGMGVDAAGPRIIEQYDPGKRAWETRAPIPMDCANCKAGTADGRIHVLSNSPSASNEIPMKVYDPGRDEWSDAPSLRGSFSDFSVCGSGGKLYVFGGQEAGVPIRSVFEYDPGSRAWNRKTDMPYAMSRHYCEEADGKIYLMGIPPSSTMLEYTPAFE